jgi:Protein of unknown function (DUF2591)
MKTIKTSEAKDAALDWLVWKCAGGIAAYPKTGSGPAFLKLWRGNSAKYVHPSTDWSQGGPIIEREKIGVQPIYNGHAVSHWSAVQEVGESRRNGPTPLIAAMRCFVASKLGEVVEVPEELT